MPLHIDKRPDSLDTFYGNEGIKVALKSVLSRTDDIPRTFLFTGPSGCGKTTLGRIVATMVGCHKNDIQEYNSSNTRGIDTVREISQNAQFSAMSGKYKLYLIDECHKMTNDAQNALLKILEDTPKHVFFVLCTTDPEKMIKAIRTRCMQFEVKELPAPVISKLVKDTVESEGIEDFSPKVIAAITKAAEGCARQSMILLDSVIDIIDEEEALRAISESTASQTASIDICKLLISDSKQKWSAMKGLLRGLPDDPEKMRYAILGYMAAVLIGDNSDGANAERASAVIDCFTESFMYSGKAALYNACFLACKI
jgi:DNA polymerase-3 subunit gamma/tau